MGGWITTLHARTSHHHHHHRHSIILHSHRYHRDEDIICRFISSSVPNPTIIKIWPLWRFPFHSGLSSTLCLFFSSLLIIPVGNADVYHPFPCCVLWFFSSFLHCVLKDLDNCPRHSFHSILSQPHSIVMGPRILILSSIYNHTIQSHAIFGFFFSLRFYASSSSGKEEFANILHVVNKIVAVKSACAWRIVESYRDAGDLRPTCFKNGIRVPLRL